jgi:transcriptional regulator with XRE-family HTH domain
MSKYVVDFTVGRRIADLRRLSGMTQAELAGRVYVTRSSVESWEKGMNYPALDSLVLLSKIFHVSIDYLLNISKTKQLVLDNCSPRQMNFIYDMVDHIEHP